MKAEDMNRFEWEGKVYERVPHDSFECFGCDLYKFADEFGSCMPEEEMMSQVEDEITPCLYSSLVGGSCIWKEVTNDAE